MAEASDHACFRKCAACGQRSVVVRHDHKRRWVSVVARVQLGSIHARLRENCRLQVFHCRIHRHSDLKSHPRAAVHIYNCFKLVHGCVCCRRREGHREKDTEKRTQREARVREKTQNTERNTEGDKETATIARSTNPLLDSQQSCCHKRSPINVNCKCVSLCMV